MTIYVQCNVSEYDRFAIFLDSLTKTGLEREPYPACQGVQSSLTLRA